MREGGSPPPPADPPIFPPTPRVARAERRREDARRWFLWESIQASETDGPPRATAVAATSASAVSSAALTLAARPAASKTANSTPAWSTCLAPDRASTSDATSARAARGRTEGWDERASTRPTRASGRQAGPTPGTLLPPSAAATAAAALARPAAAAGPMGAKEAGERDRGGRAVGSSGAAPAQSGSLPASSSPRLAQRFGPHRPGVNRSKGSRRRGAPSAKLREDDAGKEGERLGAAHVPRGEGLSSCRTRVGENRSVGRAVGEYQPHGTPAPLPSPSPGPSTGLPPPPQRRPVGRAPNLRQPSVAPGGTRARGRRRDRARRAAARRQRRRPSGGWQRPAPR